jgi:hypothetical protein
VPISFRLIPTPILWWNQQSGINKAAAFNPPPPLTDVLRRRTGYRDKSLSLVTPFLAVITFLTFVLYHKNPLMYHIIANSVFKVSGMNKINEFSKVTQPFRYHKALGPVCDSGLQLLDLPYVQLSRTLNLGKSSR